MKWIPIAAGAMLAACTSDPPAPPAMPYVNQNGCEFTLMTEGGTASTSIPKGNTMVTYTLSMGGFQVSVSDCSVVDNPDQLPLYVENP